MGLFDSATSRAKVVVFRPSSGSGRRILFRRRLDIYTSRSLAATQLLAPRTVLEAILGV